MIVKVIYNDDDESLLFSTIFLYLRRIGIIFRKKHHCETIEKRF